uniref:Uncharacterized protein n=1 Tax=Arundo donax TaxID=35708 RepID=A0A0A9H6M6_ARUDO
MPVVGHNPKHQKNLLGINEGHRNLSIVLVLIHQTYHQICKEDPRHAGIPCEKHNPSVSLLSSEDFFVIF